MNPKIRSLRNQLSGKGIDGMIISKIFDWINS